MVQGLTIDLITSSIHKHVGELACRSRLRRGKPSENKASSDSLGGVASTPSRLPPKRFGLGGATWVACCPAELQWARTPTGG